MKNIIERKKCLNFTLLTTRMSHWEMSCTIIIYFFLLLFSSWNLSNIICAYATAPADTVPPPSPSCTVQGLNESLPVITLTFKVCQRAVWPFIKHRKYRRIVLENVKKQSFGFMGFVLRKQTYHELLLIYELHYIANIYAKSFKTYTIISGKIRSFNCEPRGSETYSGGIGGFFYQFT